MPHSAVERIRLCSNLPINTTGHSGDYGESAVSGQPLATGSTHSTNKLIVLQILEKVHLTWELVQL